MKKLKYISILIIAATLAGCGTETVNNSATAPGGTTGATVQATARPTDGYETQSIQTEGQTQSAPTSGNTSASTLEPAVSSEPTPVAFEAQNGINNNNIFQIGNYIYYCSGEENLDEGVTYRMDVRTGKPEQFNDVQMLNMVYHDGWIYYVYCSQYMGDALHEERDIYGFSRIKPDGSQKGPESNMPHAVRDVFIQDGYLYAVSQLFYHRNYPDDRNKPVKFRLNNDGTLGERRALFENGNIRVQDMAYHNGRIYFTRISSEDGETQPEDFGLYSSDKNGQDIQKLGDNINDYQNLIITSDGWFYCMNNSPDDHGDFIYRMRFDGTQKTAIYQNINLASSINYFDDRIYFVKCENDYAVSIICCININGSDYKEVLKINSEKIVSIEAITEDYIIYSQFMGGLYKMDLNGGNVVELSAAYY